MKRLVFVLLSAVLLLPAMAEQRTDAEMRTLAANAIKQLDNTRHTVKARTAAQLNVLRDMDQLTLYGYSNGGWAIVSKDDAFTEVLGYSDKAVDMSDPSPEFLWLLRCFNGSMQQELKDGTAATRRKAPNKACSVLRAVQPLLKTDWAQGWPYNTKCPVVKINGEKKTCVSGCVATAYAQVLYYLRLPQKAHGKKSYTWTSDDTEESRVLSYDFDKNPFDWANLVNTYDKNKSTQAQVDAIGNFVYAIGVLATMNYSPSGSGSACATTTRNINRYFEDVFGVTSGYCETRAGKPMDVATIARELNAGRPLVYSGADDNGEGGHCFVIDGVDTKGNLHCNLGWGGSGDGFYAMEDMKNFPTRQTITTLVPSDNLGVVKPTADLMGKTLKADTEHPVTELKAGEWYVMWNEGRGVAAADLGKGQDVSVTGLVADGRRAEYLASGLVRLVPDADGTHYAIQTGLGNYFPSFAHDKEGKTAATPEYFTISTIEDKEGVAQDGHYYLLCPNNVRLDCNKNNVVGWNTGATHDVGGNASWQFFPVQVKDDPENVPVTSIALESDTLRIIVGTSQMLSHEVLPATASIPKVAWSSNKNSVASVDKRGEVTAVSKGVAVITATSADGSDITANCTLMVGTISQLRKVDNIATSTLYILRNTAGTGGYLVACDTVPGHPTLRGISSKSTSGCKDEAYWDDAPLGSPNTLWQILQDEEGNYYLYNIGAQKFLINGEEETTEYVFSDTPKPYTITPVQEGDFNGSEAFAGNFFINAGTTTSSRLMGGTNFLNPAHWLDSTTAVRSRQAVWEIQATSGIAKGLNAWTTSSFLSFLHPDGIEAATTSSRGESLAPTYDLQGRALRSGALSGSSRSSHGILIQNGQKLIR